MLLALMNSGINAVVALRTAIPVLALLALMNATWNVLHSCHVPGRSESSETGRHRTDRCIYLDCLMYMYRKRRSRADLNRDRWIQSAEC